MKAVENEKLEVIIAVLREIVCNPVVGGAYNDTIATPLFLFSCFSELPFSFKLINA
ncbi:hypothetical protein JMN32_19490 [Fulvivirga sp. 29W222]|uniref:Uncharacterized protein n=1 Tax=Fulvivirga marina TaxID=2494733 RepID=A0A937KFT4_9BACT|nr:hypothetical protein [Fulvivirga marina]